MSTPQATAGGAGALADVADLRREYATSALSEDDLAATWQDQFARWFEQASRGGVREPNAMVLATATPAGAPSARTVLLKGFDAAGFVFYTNAGSRKGREIAANDRVALLFPWHELERQVVVTGTAGPVDDATSDAYFASRPRGSQLGAWASPQSSPVASRGELTAALAEVTARFAGSDVPRPPHWGGHLVAPDAVEFWQGRPDRLHDRLVFRRGEGGGWAPERLAP